MASAPGKPTAQRGSSKPLKAPTPNRRGTTGGSFTMTGANNGPGTQYNVPRGGAPAHTQAPQAPQAPAAPAPPAPPAPIAPFLTAAQQYALGKWNLTYGNDVSTIGTDITAKNTTTQNAIGQARLTNQQRESLDTQAAGARGVGQSSIQTNNMADLDAALALRINTLNTNYNTYVSNQQGRLTTLGGENTATQNYYNSTAIANAAATPPATAAPAGTTSTGAPAQTPVGSSGGVGLPTLPAAQATAGAQAANHPASVPQQTTSTGAPSGKPTNQSPSSKPQPGPRGVSIPKSNTSAAPRTGSGGAAIR